MITPTTGPLTGRKFYLNNRDLLTEIHNSKASFSSYIDPKYIQHDMIVRDIGEITEDLIEEAKHAKIKRIGLTAVSEAKKVGKKVKLSDVTPNIEDIKRTDLVFRVMTFDHIPLANGRKKKLITTADSHERVNFPPYQHYAFDEHDNLICVGKSHWKGPVEGGEFSKSHGRITENLGKMFLMLCDRYSERSNWRGYTYVDEMRSQAILQLSATGLLFDESKSDNPFSYYTTILTNAFRRVLNAEKKMQNIRDDLLEDHGLTPSLTRQNQKVFAEEVARQAELYKNTRLPKSTQEDEFIDTDLEDDEFSKIISELSDDDEMTDDTTSTPEPDDDELFVAPKRIRKLKNNKTAQ